MWRRQTRFAAGGTAVTVVLALLLMGACSRDEPGPEAPYFAGLDPAVVSEVLDNPVVWDRIRGDSQDAMETRLQGTVMNFIVCRDLFRVYRTWVTTGTRPELGPFPMPDDPRADWSWNFSSEMVAAESGDPDQLRDVLVGPGRCGEWIPATPGDPSGLTIEDALRTLS